MTPLAWAIDLERPLWLLVLLLGPVFVWLAYRAGRRKLRSDDWTAIAFRGVLLLAVALALSVPRIEFEASSRSVAFVLDLSESIPPAAAERVQEYIGRSVSLRDDEDDVSLVVFADGAAVEAPFSRISAAERIDSVVVDPRNVTSVIGRGESDIESGLKLARAGFPPGGARRIVLATDGNQTRGDAIETIRALLADGVDVQLVPVRYRRDREVHVEKLVAPASATKGQRIPIRAVIHSTHTDVPARIRFFVEGEEVLSRDVTLDEGRNVFEIGHQFATGALYRLEMVVEPAIDGNPLNNRGRAVTHVRGDPTVLVVTSIPDSPLGPTLQELAFL